VPPHHRLRFDDGDRIQNPPEESVQPANSKRSVFYGLASCWDLRLRTITYWRSTRILGPSLARVLNNDPM